MRFLALLRKELRESLPWLLLAGLVVLAVGSVVLRAKSPYDSSNRWQYYNGMTPGEPVNAFRLFHTGRLELPGLWLAFMAPALGLILGVRHFWMPLFTRTWSFLLHRSATRTAILGAKLAAAIIALTASLGLVWTGLYWYACRPDIFPVPEATRTLVCGWIYIALGFVIYLGTALSALSTARWYTTRIFGLAFAGLAVLVILTQLPLVWAIMLMILVIAILLTQTVVVFGDREF